MTFSNRDILEGARFIRFYLQKLMGPDSDAVDKQIIQLIERANAGENSHTELLELLKKYKNTRDWMAEFLSTVPSTKGQYSRPLTQSSVAQATQKYICPVKDDFNWMRRGSEPIQSCPTCKVLLVKADQVEQ